MKLLRMPKVIEMVGLQKTAIYDRINRHKFPKPVKLGGASTWLESEITGWILEQVALSRSAATPTSPSS